MVKIKNGEVVKQERVVRTKRQPGSLQVWQSPDKFIHETVIVHHGRVTRKVIGPQGGTLDVAHEFLKSDLKAGKI